MVNRIMAPLPESWMASWVYTSAWRFAEGWEALWGEDEDGLVDKSKGLQGGAGLLGQTSNSSARNTGELWIEPHIYKHTHTYGGLYLYCNDFNGETHTSPLQLHLGFKVISLAGVHVRAPQLWRVWQNIHSNRTERMQVYTLKDTFAARSKPLTLRRHLF